MLSFFFLNRERHENPQTRFVRSEAAEMTEEIDGYKDDLDRQVATLRDGLDRLSRAKEDKKSNVRRFEIVLLRPLRLRSPLPCLAFHHITVS